MTTEMPMCPRCGSSMVLRTAGRGPYVGQRFWGCSTFPVCRARIGVRRQIKEGTAPPVAAEADVAGRSAQAEFDTRQRRRAERVRQVLPLFVGITLVSMLVVYLTIQSLWGPTWGAAAAGGIGLLSLLTYFGRPQMIEAWRVGAEGERRTGAYLDGLREAGFVGLHDRKAPGYGGNLDHVAIGPTGIWAIETKSLAGKVVIDGDSLRIGGRNQDRIIDQVFREATAVQVALREPLAAHGLTVTPVVCLHRAELPLFNKSVRGVRLASGRQLVRLLRDGEPRLSPQAVQALADQARRLLPKA